MRTTRPLYKKVTKKYKRRGMQNCYPYIHDNYAILYFLSGAHRYRRLIPSNCSDPTHRIMVIQKTTADILYKLSTSSHYAI